MPRQKAASVRPLLYGTTALLVVQAINFILAQADIESNRWRADTNLGIWRLQTATGSAASLLAFLILVNLGYSFLRPYPRDTLPNSRSPLPGLARLAAFLPPFLQFAYVLHFSMSQSP